MRTIASNMHYCTEPYWPTLQASKGHRRESKDSDSTTTLDYGEHRPGIFHEEDEEFLVPAKME